MLYTLSLKKIFTGYSPLVGMVLLYCVYFCFLSIYRHHTFQTAIYDLGNMNQTVWNTLHGHFFMETDPTQSGVLVSRLSDHADFFLLLLAPIYAIFPSVYTLLSVQTIIIALGAIPVFLLAKRYTKNIVLPYFFVLCYLLFPAIENTNAFDFHAVSLATTFILFAFYFLATKRYLLSLIPLILALSTKEEVGFTLMFLLLYFFCIHILPHFTLKDGIRTYLKNSKQSILEKKKEALFLLLTALCMFGYSLCMIVIVIPHFRTHTLYISYFPGYQKGIVGIMQYTLTHPLTIIQNQFPYDGKYLTELLAPLDLMSLFSPVVLLLSLPDLLIDLLSTNHAMQDIVNQYSAVLNAFIFLSFISGFFSIDQSFKKHWKKYQTWILVSIVLCSLLFWSYLTGPLFFGRHSRSFTPTIDAQDTKEIFYLASTIPASASISADNNIGGHFSSREDIYIYPTKAGSADYIIIKVGEATTIPANDHLLYKGKTILVYTK